MPGFLFLAVIAAAGCGDGKMTAGGDDTALVETVEQPDAWDGGQDAATEDGGVDAAGDDGGGDPGDARTDTEDLAQEEPPFECPAPSGRALSLDGTDDRVSMGRAAALGLAAFTLEAWVRWEGGGAAAGSGAGGVSLIPIIAKGRGEHDGSNVDCNYIFGIEEGSHVLAADFEDRASGANHPVTGRTPLSTGVWHHAAATYDGTTWRIYLDGTLDAELRAGAAPRDDSIQHFALGSALDSTGAAQGAFEGALDEVRVWDRALAADRIADGLGREIADAEGLVGRWALDETSGTTAADSKGTSPGTLAGGTWIEGGAPFAVVPAPGLSLIGPADGATVPAAGAELGVWVDASGGLPLVVTFEGRAVDPDFTVAVLPDTQHYSRAYPELFVEQGRWVSDNAERYNIRAVLHAGDITDDGSSRGQWSNADGGMTELERPLPGMPDGVPYGLAVGNHDQRGTTALFNETFGIDRFEGLSYYGGHYGSDYDNHFILFDAGSTGYVALFMEYDDTPDAAVLTWAHGVIASYPDRRALVTIHYFIGTGNPGAWGGQGRAVYDALKDLANIDLFLCGHVTGEGRRSDTAGGHTIHTLLADYQGRESGGNGWMRLLFFSPARGTIHVRTWSTHLRTWETDADSDFTLVYDSPAPDFAPVARRDGVEEGAAVEVPWPGLDAGQTYQWRATVTNCVYETTGPSWTFTAR